MARSYRLRGYMAMWLVEVGIVQFYDAQGNMLETLNLFEELKPHAWRRRGGMPTLTWACEASRTCPRKRGQGIRSADRQECLSY